MFHKMRQQHNRLKGFTLTEIIAVIVIMMAMAGFAIPNMAAQYERIKTQEAVVTLMSIHMEQKDYALDNAGAYTTDWNDLGMDQPTLDNYTNLALSSASTQTCGSTTELYLASVDDDRHNPPDDPSYQLYVLEDGRVVCQPCASQLCIRLGFPSSW